MKQELLRLKNLNHIYKQDVQAQKFMKNYLRNFQILLNLRHYLMLNRLN